MRGITIIITICRSSCTVDELVSCNESVHNLFTLTMVGYITSYILEHGESNSAKES